MTPQSCWQLEIISPSGTSVLTVPQLVFAVGTSGFAQTPSFAGHDTFEGQQLHSSAYQTGAEFTGKKVRHCWRYQQCARYCSRLAQERRLSDDDPAQFPRTSSLTRYTLATFEHSVWGEHIIQTNRAQRLFKRFSAHAQIGTAGHRHLQPRQTGMGVVLREPGKCGHDARLRRRWRGHFAANTRRTKASGYYGIDENGGSQRVIDGEIGLRSGVGVKRVEQDGIVLTDTSSMSADAIIYATGFGSMEQWVAALIDKETADKVGPCWGYGSGVIGDPGPWQGELRNMWKPTAQKKPVVYGWQLSAGTRYVSLSSTAIAASNPG